MYQNMNAISKKFWTHCAIVYQIREDNVWSNLMKCYALLPKRELHFIARGKKLGLMKNFRKFLSVSILIWNLTLYWKHTWLSVFKVRILWEDRKSLKNLPPFFELTRERQIKLESFFANCYGVLRIGTWTLIKSTKNELIFKFPDSHVSIIIKIKITL